MNTPVLYMVCGAPGSGKTVWCHKFMQENKCEYVSRDAIRFGYLEDKDAYFQNEEKVFRVFVNTICGLLAQGYNVIADATHLHPASRRKLLRAIDKYYNSYNIVFIYFNVSLETCLARNKGREGRARVPDQIVANMYKCLRAPTKDEDKRCIGVWEVNG